MSGRGVGGVMFRRFSNRAGRYPHADLADWAKKSILHAVMESWNELSKEMQPFDDENDLTAVLVDGMNEILHQPTVVPGFSSALFQTVQRDGCNATFDGTSLQKRPDMVVRLVDRIDDQEGWMIECKIVDDNHSPDLYYTKGINRFVDGDYAWSMPSALMLAYAGDGYELTDISHLVNVTVSALAEDGLDVYDTTHQRLWCYPGSNRRPGDIVLAHLWLYGAPV